MANLQQGLRDCSVEHFGEDIEGFGHVERLDMREVVVAELVEYILSGVAREGDL